MNMTDTDKALRLEWKRASDGTSWFAHTGEVDGWIIVVSEVSINIVHNTDVIAMTLRSEKDRNAALRQAESFARAQIMKRFGLALMQL